MVTGVEDRGKGRGRLYDNVIETIGNTPCIKLSAALTPPGRTIYAKCEFFNPLSSVKDRLAAAIIEDAEAKGLLKPGDTVVEATSGNTGIALAMVCAQRGYKCVITMAEPFSIERRKLMRMMGAKVIITPKSGKGSGMVKKAKELADKHGWFLCRQFETEANAAFHYKTTGKEILADFEGQRLDYFVLGYGTGGTFAGAGKAIKEGRPDVKICLSEPETAKMLASGQPSERDENGAATGTHPVWAAHPIQGWAPDFIPLVLEAGQKEVQYDELLHVPGTAGVEIAQQLARTQGIFTGISGGASIWTAIEMAKKAPEGSVLCAILADTGERYLTTPLFASIEADMNADELEISKSTPNFQLG
jgi:cysteine synthase A